MSKDNAKRQIAKRFTARPCKSRIRMKSAFDTPGFSKELSGWDNALREERPCLVPAKCEALARLEKTRLFDLPKFKRASGQKKPKAFYIAVTASLVQNTKPDPLFP